MRPFSVSPKGYLEAVEVAAMFHFTNRLANSLGFRPNPEYYGGLPELPR